MQNRHRSIRITELKRMLEGLKSLYMTGFSCLWRNSRPFAAPRRIFTLVNQGKAPPYSALHQTVLILLPRSMYSYTRSLSSSSQQYPTKFTRCGCFNWPRIITSACRISKKRLLLVLWFHSYISCYNSWNVIHWYADGEEIITSHSLWPCPPSRFKALTATGWSFKPVLRLSSTKPL
jgi:hypothetical protein